MLEHISEHDSLSDWCLKFCRHKFLFFALAKEQSQPYFAPLLQFEIFTLETDSLSDSMVAISSYLCYVELF